MGLAQTIKTAKTAAKIAKPFGVLYIDAAALCVIYFKALNRRGGRFSARPVSIWLRERQNTMKKALSLLLAAGLMLSLAACGASGTAGTSAPADSTPAASEPADGGPGADAGNNADTTVDEDTAKAVTVGIIQLVQHEALDAATEGFEDALEAHPELNVTFDYQNAQGDSNTCATVANNFVSNGYDLIMANATAALQAAQAATDTIPVLGTSITEYGVALGIDGFTGTVGGNISGTSDLAPLDQQAAMLQELFPDAKTVGLLYCSAEPNSQYQVDTVQGFLEDAGLTCTQYSFSDSNDLATVCQNAADASDVLYIPTDNTAASNTEIINNICYGKVPVIAGEEGICAGCGVATLSISYYDIGYATGEMAAKILNGEANIAEMPIEYAPEFTKKYNAANAEALGVAVPEDYVAIEG